MAYVKKSKQQPTTFKDTLTIEQQYRYESLVTFYCTNLKTEGPRTTMKGSFVGLYDHALTYKDPLITILHNQAQLFPFDSDERISYEQVIVSFGFQHIHKLF